MNLKFILNTQHKSLYLKAFVLLLAIFLVNNICYSQKPSKEEKKLYKKAKKQLANEDLKKAQKSYLKLIEIDNKNEYYNFEGGLSFYFADFESSKCIPLFEATLENSKEDTIPELYYYLARAYHFNGQYKESQQAFNKFKPFIKSSTRPGQELMKQSDYFISIDKIGMEYEAKRDDKVVIKNLGVNINSSYGEYAPVEKEKDNILLFTSRRKSGNNKVDKDLLPFEDVYVAKKVDDLWKIITDKEEIEKYVPKNLNTKKHDAGIIYSSDGKTLYTYKNDLIWKSIFDNGKWSKLVELDKNINSSQYNIPSVTISKDGNTLFFVSTRKDGFGGKDIYKSVKNSNGKWEVAENLGDNINSKYDDDSPFITEDGKTLYFSSKGHKGIGGYDIFKSKFVNGGWGVPVNMGIPINSPLDDIYLIMNVEEKKGFFASAREGGYGGMDIYSLCMDCPTKIINTINGLLVDNNETPINTGNITFESKSNNQTIGTYPTTTDGKFTIVTQTIGTHSITVEVPNYKNQSVTIDIPNTSSTTDVKIKMHRFQNKDHSFQVLTLLSNKLGLNFSDTIILEKILATNNDNQTNNNPITNLPIGSYQEFYNYNLKGINISNSKFSELINKTINKTKKGDEIYIDIESSASRVPTKTFKSNIRLASIRGDEAKNLIIKLLLEKGVVKDKIIVNSINSIVSGPKYTGDYKNIEKYHKFQYVKINIK